MNILVRRPRGVLLLLGCICMGGCLPSGPNPVDEQKEAHFLEGKSLVNALDYHGAIESFERALEVNPKSAAAHFELAWLFDQKETDPAAAIYHYDQYLKLHPNSENAETVKLRITACKMQLAGTATYGPVTQTLQRDIEQLTEENKRLKEQLAFYKTNTPPVINRPALAPGPAPARLAPAPVVAGAVSALAVPNPSPSASAERPAAAPSSGARVHTVKSGETPILIARKYGVKVDALMAANPRLDARRMRVGQSLNIPGA